MTPTARMLAGRYRLREVIGQGGMAVVHRAHDELLDRVVAIKVLRPAYAIDPEFVVRFRREAHHAASLHHPNIVTIHDRGVDPESGTDYIVMRLVDGPDLETVMSRDGRLGLGEAVRIGIETTRALQVAHEHGIVHRDVKPANILIDRDGEVRVADFGIARAVHDTGATTAGVVLGSPQYASPEQVLGEPITPASDIYSLGVVLYEAITGWRPFDGPSPAAVALERLRIEPSPPSTIAPEVPKEIDRIILRAMAREPADRYPSAAEFGIALDRFRMLELGGIRRSGARIRGTSASSAKARAAGAAAAAGGAAVAVGGAIAGPAGPATVADADGTAAWTTPVHPVARRRHGVSDGRRRRAVPPLAVALPLVALALVSLIGVWVFGGGGETGAVLSATGTPGAGAVNDIALLPTPSPALSPTVSPSPTRSPTAIPTATLAPPPAPTARPTPRPTARPTPKPATAPAAGPTAPARDPAETVSRFYDLVEDHRYNEAARLWSTRMRAEYPPDGNIDGRFDATTRIEINRIAIRSMNLSTKRAVVFVDLTEYRRAEPSRHWVGTWDLVLRSAGWLMDDPHF